MPALSAREAYDGVRARKLILVDIRTPEEWTDTGVPKGALRFDAEASGFEVRLAGLRVDYPNKRIILIDRSGGQASSVQQKLAGRGWRDLAIVRAGMLGNGGWLAERLPVEAP
ncbi:rhodanese-like domain-containing protein [Bosea caraganae]|uniref:Rhodanese-like domain-containing protein n=1 Tax=Bosea caraganae TaxID=2763117 RepID=A0A370L0S9_9HYPH|nr:rhodanese-like domain-containing protein [Bosea caraganae]RDJ28505.1 rhodanese-like domain-containing protein [Bosea caraganae]